MSYILRRVIWEDRWKQQLKELLDWCPRIPIEEVLFIEQSHAVIQVPFPVEKHRLMAEIYGEMAQALLPRGIRVSVNIVSLVGHTDMNVPASMILPYQKNM